MTAGADLAVYCPSCDGLYLKASGAILAALTLALYDRVVQPSAIAALVAFPARNRGEFAVLERALAVRTARGDEIRAEAGAQLLEHW